jgi:hypothetical protein
MIEPLSVIFKIWNQTLGHKPVILLVLESATEPQAANS